MHFYPDMASTLCCPTFCPRSALLLFYHRLSTTLCVQTTIKTVCTTCAHNAPTAHAPLHKKGMPNFVHLHRVPQPFVLREIENHITGGRNDSALDCSFYLPWQDFLPHATVFTRSATGVAKMWLTRALQPYITFLRTVQASVDKRADVCRHVCRHFSMLPTLHNALIITQCSIISTECRHFCK